MEYIPSPMLDINGKSVCSPTVYPRSTHQMSLPSMSSQRQWFLSETALYTNGHWSLLRNYSDAYLLLTQFQKKAPLLCLCRKEISKILDVVTRLENKVDRLTGLLTKNSQSTENSESFETREFHQTIHEEIEQRNTQESQPKF